jgi:hypothetical protein
LDGFVTSAIVAVLVFVTNLNAVKELAKLEKKKDGLDISFYLDYVELLLL